MPNDVEDMFASLSQDATRARLDAPDVLRRRSDRRVAVRSVASVAAAAVLVAGVAVGTRFVLSDQAGPLPAPPAATTAPVVVPTTPSAVSATPTSPAASVTSVPGTSTPSTSGPSTVRRPTIPSAVPTSAFLSRADFNATETPHDQSDSATLPDLCGADFADGTVALRDKRFAPYRRKGDPADYVPLATLIQTVTVFRGDGAETFVDELRDAVADCPTQTRGSDKWRYKLLTPVDAGDESLMIEASLPTRDDTGELAADGSRTSYFCSVARVGDMVTTLWATGWESSAPERPALDGFTRRAVERLQDWRG